MPSTTPSEKVLRDIRPEDDENLFDSFMRGGTSKKPPPPKPSANAKAKQQNQNVKPVAAAKPSVIPKIIEHPPEESAKAVDESLAKRELETPSKTTVERGTEPDPQLHSQSQTQPPQEDPKKPRYRDNRPASAADAEAALNSGNFMAWVTNGKQDDFGHAGRHLFGSKTPT